MIAMQYSFVLPADYDMAIIRQRIASKGHLLDHFPRLIFKAYLSADRENERTSSRENLYAPFYLWEDSEGMNNFLCGEGFAGLTQSFGWPSVKTWSVWRSCLSNDITEARYATREVIAIPPYASLSELRQRESDEAQEAVIRGGVLCAVTGFEPMSWTLVRLRLWHDLHDSFSNGNLQQYEVGHISLPRQKR